MNKSNINYITLRYQTKKQNHIKNNIKILLGGITFNFECTLIKNNGGF